MTPRVLPLGDAAFTVEFGQVIDPLIQARVLGLATLLAAARDTGELAGVIEWVPTFRSLTVHFDPDHLDATALANTLLQLAGQAHSALQEGRRWQVPVCFGGEAGPDLDAVAQACRLSPAVLVQRLTASEFTVCMLGFLPGFPYLSGLPAELALPRRATPRTRVPAGSVAIAGGMAAIYPWESPGGWHLLGRSAWPLFDPRRAEPALFAPGDRIRWVAVTPDALTSAATPAPAP